MIIDLGLADYYEPFLPGSGTALAASMVGAYEQGEPWIGYYWEPTAVLGRLDMIMIPGTEFPPTSVDILVNTEFSKTDPVLMEMLRKYNTTIDQNNKVLAAMQDNDLDAEGAAEWFLRNFEDTWTDWVPEDVAENVKDALK
jgi:glycine betaine/proline transport system substrate-binding protein